MPEVAKSVIVAATPADMFRLVDAVEDYPRFLPWCAGAEVLERTLVLTHARIHVNYHGLKTSFATVNRKEPPEWMLGDEGCRVDFALEYAFASRAVEAVLGPVFGHVAGTLVDAFVKRSRDLGSSPEGAR